MKIIDTHAHIGTSRFSGVTITGEDLLSAMEKNSVAAALVLPQAVGLEESRKVHREIYDMSGKHPGRIFGVACVDPWVGEKDYLGEIARCAEEYGFKALKINSHGHNISPLSQLCDKVYRAASRYGLPVIFHTGLGTPVSLPSLAMKPARDHPDVTFILAHAGFALYCDEAIVAGEICPNIILEPSWCPTFMVGKMVKTLGIGRIIMGSDHLTNLPLEVLKYQCIGLTDAEQARVYFDNPNRIFNLGI